MKNKSGKTIVANEKISTRKLTHATKIISDLQNELPKYIKHGHGPFLAAIYDKKGHLIAKKANSVILNKCSHNHAEINAINAAEKVLKTFDLSKHNLALYVTAEPCMMCLGAILWSGIREVYYGVSSKSVHNITGFDEGFKPNWLKEFKKRGISVYGHIETQAGEKILQDYMTKKHPSYKPKRK